VEQDKRKGDKPLPDNIQDYLNTEQLNSLRKIEGFGWQLKFIRRPLFMEPLAVVVSPDGTSIGILEEDGRLNLDYDIPIRD
jgi:hypothetical protein